MRSRHRRCPLFLFLGSIVLLLCGESVKAARPIPGSDEAIRQSWNEWNAPFKPFRLIGNIYYVGTAGISSFLITSPTGHILIDTGFEMTVPRITNSVAELGFRLRDIRIILSS